MTKPEPTDAKPKTTRTPRAPKAPSPLPYDARPLYRIHFPLSYKDDVLGIGTLHRLEGIEGNGVEILLRKGTISVVQAPPLAVLPGWARRAQRLAEYGIENAVQFLGVDVPAAAAALDVKPDTVRRWQGELEYWMNEPPPKRRR